MTDKPYTVSIVSPRGGTGKTTLSFELGKAFASSGKRVLLVDLDPKLDLTSITGIEPDSQYVSMAEVLLKETSIHNTLANTGEFTVAISSSKLASAEVWLFQPIDGITRLRDALSGIHPMFDMIIVDCPPTMGRLTQNAIVASNLTLTPVTEDLNIENSIIPVNEAVDSARQHLNSGPTELKMVKVLYDGKDQGKNTQVLSKISDRYPHQFLRTTVKELSRIREGYLKGQLEMNMVSTEDIVELSKELLNEMAIQCS